MIPVEQNAAPASGSTAGDDDVVRDIIARVLARWHDAPANVANEVEQEVRRDWGGDRPYIAKSGQVGEQLRSARDKQICSEHRRGEREAFLSRRWNISIRRIRQIIRSGGNGLP